MVANATKASWQQGQDALRDVVGQVTTLLRSIEDPGAPAVGQWNLGEVAMHLSQVWVNLPAVARQDLSPVHELLPSTADTGGGAMIRDIWDLGDLMILGVKSDPERDLKVLADRIEARAEKYFSECAEALDAPHPWFVQGVTLRRSTLTYNLLSETVIHGYDIAHAAGRKWKIEPAHAAMALEGLVIPAIQASDPRTFVNEAKAAGLRATYNVRIRGGSSFYFIFEDGAVTIEEPSARTVDCHISADPVAFLLVAWERQSQWAAIAQGKLMAWGRKPWLGFQFKGLLRTP